MFIENSHDFITFQGGIFLDLELINFISAYPIYSSDSGTNKLGFGYKRENDFINIRNDVHITNSAAPMATLTGY